MVSLSSLMLLLFLCLGAAVAQFLPECVPKYYGEYGGEVRMVCVCNATYCDEVESPGVMGANEAMGYTTNLKGRRMDRDAYEFSSSPSSPNVITIDPSKTYQDIMGFGGAFTDATGINIESLNGFARNKLMDSYFSVKGIEYSLCRTVIGGNEFSNRYYSNDDVDGDLSLTKFDLTNEDLNYKIKYIRKALDITGGNINMVATAWSAPGWMKTNGNASGGYSLKGNYMGDYYNAYANYLVKAIETFTNFGIPIWALTMANQPQTTAGDTTTAIPAMNFTAETQRDFISTLLGKALSNSQIANSTKLLMLDDQRYYLQDWAQTVLRDVNANKYVSGIAMQWFGDSSSGSGIIDIVHTQFRDKFFLYTQAASGFDKNDNPGVFLGDWQRADRYVFDIIENLSHLVSGWIDYNMVLNPTGGPSVAGVSYDSPIIVNTTSQEFYKQPMFYAMGHFSKFIRPDAKVVDLQQTLLFEVSAVAAVNPWGQRVMVILNSALKESYNISVTDTSRPGKYLNLQLGPREFQTIVWDAPLH